MEIDWTPVLQNLINLLAALVAVLVPVVVGYVTVWVRGRWEEFLMSRPEDVRLAYESAARFGIRIAEIVGAELKLEAKEKLRLATDKARQWLAEQGYEEVSIDLLESVIESLLDATKAQISEEKISKHEAASQLQRIG
jgi:hypothetical protein